MNRGQFNSIQDFGYNRFGRSHSVLGSYNMGLAYPIGCFDVPAGATLGNDLDVFIRSSALVNPAFLDADISVGHYFVSYEAIDNFYRLRCQQFKGNVADQPLLTATFPGGNKRSLMNRFFGPNSLADHLGFGVTPIQGSDGNWDRVLTLPFAPFLAYQMIIDRFFRNSHIYDVERTKKMTLQLFPNLATTDYKVLFSEFDGQIEDLFNLQYVLYEPDYFTTARPEAGGANVLIPGSQGETTGTIHELLDAMLLQKVRDMIERGGYSYNDYLRVIYNTELHDEISEYPVFLGGASSPLQVSTVTASTIGFNSATDEVSLPGDQAGTVSAYVRGDDKFVRRFDRAGLYIPMMWIRPVAYYPTGISPVFQHNSLGTMLIPQFADMTDEPIFQSEVIAQLASLQQNPVSGSVFGYKDRYNEYRTTPNRVVGDMRTTNASWYVGRDFGSDPAITPSFVTMSNANYAPWVDTKKSVNHFQARIHQNFWNTVPLPQTSKPYVW